MSAPADEPPVLTPPSIMPGKGQSDIFKAVAKLQESKSYSTPPNAPTGPQTGKEGTPSEPVAPVKPEREIVSQPTKPTGSPLDLINTPAEPVKPAPSGGEEFKTELEEFDKTLPTAYEGMGLKPKESWDKMRESSKAAKREALQARKDEAALKARIAELEKAPPVSSVAPEEIERIKSENLTLKQKNAVWDLETNDQFVNGVLKPLDNASTALGSLMETYKISAGDLDKAFGEKDRSARNKAFSQIITDTDMNPLDVEDFKKAVTDITDLTFKRDEGYRNAMTLNEAAHARVKEEQAKKQEMTKKEIEAEEGKVWDKISKNAPVIKDILSDSTVSSEIRGKVKDLLGSEQSHEMKVFSAYTSFLAQHLVNTVKTLQEEITTLKASVKEKVDGESSAGGGHPQGQRPSPTTQGPAPKPGFAIGQAVESWRRSTGQT